MLKSKMRQQQWMRKNASGNPEECLRQWHRFLGNKKKKGVKMIERCVIDISWWPKAKQKRYFKRAHLTTILTIFLLKFHLDYHHKFWETTQHSLVVIRVGGGQWMSSTSPLTHIFTIVCMRVRSTFLSLYFFSTLYTHFFFVDFFRLHRSLNRP